VNRAKDSKDFMYSYAQTNIQLFNQLRREGYSNTDLSFVRDAYELTMVLYSGRFLPSGRPFIAHVVRTASILASLHLSAQVVAAGLLHNVYDTGDFGDARRGISTAKRQNIRRVLGPEVETYLTRFPTSYWESGTMKLARTNPDQLPPIDRTVVLILLADHLEHLLDLDVLYYVAAERRCYLNNSRMGAQIAERLGMSRLAADLDEAVRETESAELPVEISLDKVRDMSFVIAPASCRKSFSVVLRSALAGGLHRLPPLLRKIKLLCAN
jgi:(p)ppGpp synthase/HD superfamily hydrolase